MVWSSMMSINSRFAQCIAHTAAQNENCFFVRYSMPRAFTWNKGLAVADWQKCGKACKWLACVVSHNVFTKEASCFI